MTAPVQRPGVVPALTEHEKRIRALERSRPNFFAGSGEYSTGVHSLSDLVGYWRLGDGASPYLDTSGFAPGDPANMTRQIRTVAMTQDYTPGAPIVDDDGAVQFNAAGDATTVVGDFLQSGSYVTNTTRFSFHSNLPYSVACWMRPLASANVWEGTLIGNVAVSSFGDPSANDNGWRFDMTWPSRVLGFTRAAQVMSGDPYPSAVTPAGLAAAEWHHIVGTYDGADLRLYVAGALVDTVAAAGNLAGTNNPPSIGTGPAPLGSFATFYYGAIDEAAVWSRALTAEEVAFLYLSGNVPAAGSSIVSDGSGGTVILGPRTVYLNGS